MKIDALLQYVFERMKEDGECTLVVNGSRKLVTTIDTPIYTGEGFRLGFDDGDESELWYADELALISLPTCKNCGKDCKQPLPEKRVYFEN